MRLKSYCNYCGCPAGFLSKKQKDKHWGFICSGCKGTFTKWLKSEKYTINELMSAKYDYKTSQWRINCA